MNELYRDFIDTKADAIINSLGGTITPAPANAELYRDFLDRKFDDVINATKEIKIKEHHYTGNGQTVNTIVFPDDVKYIINIQRKTDYSSVAFNSMVCPIIWDYTATAIGLYQGTSGTPSIVQAKAQFTNNKTIILTATTSGQCFNVNNLDYTVLYIPKEN